MYCLTPPGVQAPAPAIGCHSSIENRAVRGPSPYATPVPVAGVPVVSSRSPEAMTWKSGSMVQTSTSRPTRLSSLGSFSFTQSDPSAFLRMNSSPSSYSGEAPTETKPLVTTTAEDAPVTGTPQESSLIRRITDALIGDTHVAVMLLTPRSQTFGVHRYPEQTAVESQQVRTFGNGLYGVDRTVQRGLPREHTRVGPIGENRWRHVDSLGIRRDDTRRRSPRVSRSRDHRVSIGGDESVSLAVQQVCRIHVGNQGQRNVQDTS